jgi:hypothetical protein
LFLFAGAQAFSARDTGSFFTLFYTATVVSAVALCTYFMTTSYPCAGGPFRDTASRYSLAAT